MKGNRTRIFIYPGPRFQLNSPCPACLPACSHTGRRIRSNNYFLRNHILFLSSRLRDIISISLPAPFFLSFFLYFFFIVYHPSDAIAAAASALLRSFSRCAARSFAIVDEKSPDAAAADVDIREVGIGGLD